MSSLWNLRTTTGERSLLQRCNAVMRSLGIIEGSVHCKDKGPAECGLDLLEFLEGCRGARIALVGFQPVHARRCSERGELNTRYGPGERRRGEVWCCGAGCGRGVAMVRFKRLLRVRRLLMRRLIRYWWLRGRRRSFMGSASRGLRSCFVSSGSVQGRRDGAGFSDFGRQA